MNNDQLQDTPDMTFGFYRYAIFDTGETKYLNFRSELDYFDQNGAKVSHIYNALRDFGKSISARSFTIFHIQSKNSNPIELETIII